LPPNPALADVEKKLSTLETQLQTSGQKPDSTVMQQYFALREEQSALERERVRQEQQRFQGDWAARVLNNGKVTGLFAEYHYYGTGDIGGAPRLSDRRRNRRSSRCRLTSGSTSRI
jgi:alpha-mannosidase